MSIYRITNIWKCLYKVYYWYLLNLNLSYSILPKFHSQSILTIHKIIRMWIKMLITLKTFKARFTTKCTTTTWWGTTTTYFKFISIFKKSQLLNLKWWSLLHNSTNAGYFFRKPMIKYNVILNSKTLYIYLSKLFRGCDYLRLYLCKIYRLLILNSYFTIHLAEESFKLTHFLLFALNFILLIKYIHATPGYIKENYETHIPVSIEEYKK
jgi:hypothetical protein